MAARKPDGGRRPLRKRVAVDAARREKARQLLGVGSDAEVLRLALDHLLGHFEGHDEEE